LKFADDAEVLNVLKVLLVLKVMSGTANH